VTTEFNPVILLTALAAETDRIIGLEIGADDYVCKPFSPRELLARIRVVLRRHDASPGAAQKSSLQTYGFDGWTLDVRARTLSSPTSAYVELTTGEFELLQAFVEHPNVVLTRDELLDLARGRASLTVDRAIAVQVMRLRRKLESDPQVPQTIKTVRNGGYIFTPVVRTFDGNG
jgi:two-component system OmpR family response regulator